MTPSSAHERTLCAENYAFRCSALRGIPGRVSQRCLPQRAKLLRMDSRGWRQKAVGVDADGNGTFSTQLPGAVKDLYLDFDDTISEGLSANVQVKAVIECIAKRMQSPEEAGVFVQERKALIAKLAAEYEAAVKENLGSIFMKFPKGEFSMDAINEAMDICAEFDRKWAQVSTDNEVFAGVRKDDFLSVAPLTPLRENALESIAALQSSGINVAIASINWSAEWIQKVMGDKSSVVSDGSAVPEGHIQIYSNEMLFEDDISTGKLKSLMESGREKANVIRQLMQESAASNGSTQAISVFVGDSYNDIQPLLMADVGIIMGQNPGLIAFAQHFNIAMRPLNGDVKFSQAASDAPVLYTTNSWTDVTEALLGKEQAARALGVLAE